ncbi:RNA-directed DNA polymerase [Fusobacteria bacterium ZRK30]|nr:RNA-directed DNA polymerase [Fusobacteria bacterium ZRK30]
MCSATDIIKAEFKEDGFFSEYLPSNFNLSNSRINIFNIKPSNKTDYIDPYKYTMSRFSKEESRRRTIHLPELAPYVLVSNYICDEDILSELIDFTETYGDNSFSKLLYSDKTIYRHDKDYSNLITTTDESDLTYLPNIEKKINKAKGAKGVLHLDISNCYGSIYTHLLPSILLGYEKSFLCFRNNGKPNLSITPQEANDYCKYKELDSKVGLLNGKRTNGLLTGSLISSFLVESFLTRIDIEIERLGINFSRYVDDYEIYIYDETNIDALTAQLREVLSKYHLDFNNEKAKFLKFPYYVVENLQQIYSKYTRSKMTNSELMKLFNKYFELENSGIKGAIRFLIKSIDDKLDLDNKVLYSSFLLNVLVNDKRSLTKVCELIISENIEVDEKYFEIIINLLHQNIKNKNDLEVIWLIYLLKSLRKVTLGKDLLSKIIESENELAIIMLMEEYGQEINDYNLKEDIINLNCSWILSAQLYLKDYITKEEFSLKSEIKFNLPFYSRLRAKKFTFYKPIGTQ